MMSEEEKRMRYCIYNVFGNMKSRCYKPNNKDYDRYGQRGITICDEWLNEPSSFYRWALTHGYKLGLSIDRVDNDKGYSPENCRFVTLKENNRNKSTNHFITFRNETHCLVEWAEIRKLSYCALRKRVEKKWNVEKMLTEPIHIKNIRKKKEVNPNEVKPKL